MNQAMETVHRIVNNPHNDGISEQQIRNVAAANEIDKKELRKIIKKEDIKITKFTADVNESSMKKYF